MVIAACQVARVDDIDPQTVTLIPLRNADATSIIPQIRDLQTAAQRKVVTIAAGPDGRSVIVSALSSESDQVRRIVDILDQAGRIERRTQVLKVQAAKPADTIAAAKRILASERDPRSPEGELDIGVASDGRTLTVAGTQAAIARFEQALKLAEQATVVERSTRVFELKYAQATKGGTGTAADGEADPDSQGWHAVFRAAD